MDAPPFAGAPLLVLDITWWQFLIGFSPLAFSLDENFADPLKLRGNRSC
jgi:hypothetical protein